MKSKSSWAAASRALAVAAVTLVVVTALASDASAVTYKILHKFRGRADGSGPSSLVIDSAGNLYGTTYGAGIHAYGTVFKIDTTGKFTVLYSFTGGIDGGNCSAYGTLALDAIGNLYGVSYAGGAYGEGTVFQVDPGGVETVLYSFSGGADGGRPHGGVIFDQSGNLYGTTTRGGNGLGVLFKLTPNLDGPWTENVLHSFPAYSGDAAEPYAGLSWDSAGNLYGATWQGGANYQGAIFKFDTNGNESVFHSFTGADGAHAYRPPIFDSAGNLYDTTAFGGDYSCPSPLSGCGTAIKVDKDGNVTRLHAFHGRKDGSFPVAGLTLDQAGNLYGTAQLGGRHGYGTVYMLTIGQDDKATLKVVHTFADHPGAEPISTIVFDAKGNLYGSADGYALDGFGSVFAITP